MATEHGSNCSSAYNLNRVIQEENELGDSRFFQYNTNSVLVEKTDRNERVTQYVPDNLGRIVQEKWLAGESVIRTFDFEFDAADQLVSAADPDASYGFVYDALGRDTSTTAELIGFSSSIVMAQTFDASSNRTQLAVTVGTTADFVNDYTLDNLNRQIQIGRHGEVGGNTVAETRIDLGYNAASQFDTIDRFADLAGENLVLTTAHAYDGIGRLANLDHSQGATALTGYAFTYDTASRITEIDSLIDGLTTYSYDTTSQLTAADFATQNDEAHVWDANGNPGEANFDVGPNNQILSDGEYDYEYDDEGNRTRRTKISDGSYTDYLWDHRNRLTDVIDFDVANNVLQHVHYAYDFLDRWILREIDADGAGEDPSTAEWFAFDGYQVVLSFDDAEATEPSHRYLNGPVVDQYFTDENAENDVLQLLGDHLGTIRDTALYDSVTEETELKNHTTYTSFNARLADTDAAFASLIGETGRPHDFDTGLDNHWHRWLDASLRQWLSEDPIGFFGRDGNLRRMVGNNTVSLIDPTGQSAWGKAGKQIVETLTKLGVKRRWYQVHHLIGREIFDDTKYAKWLAKLGIEKNCAKNLVALPTKLGKKKKYMEGAAKHYGKHIDEYVDSVRKSVGDIMKKHKAGEISDKQAKNLIHAFQDELREGLEDGTIALSKDESEILKKGGILSIGGLFFLASQQTVDASERANDAREVNRAIKEAWEKDAPVTGSYWCGKDSWLGWGIDMFNPLDDLRTAIELFGDFVEANPNIPWDKAAPSDGPGYSY